VSEAAACLIVQGERMIESAAIVPLHRIPGERGRSCMLPATKHFIEFGEIYFTTIYQGVVKGNRHTR
jgi:hypothetical protein